MQFKELIHKMREQELREDSYFREGRDFSSEIFIYFFT